MKKEKERAAQAAVGKSKAGPESPSGTQEASDNYLPHLLVPAPSRNVAIVGKSNPNLTPNHFVTDVLTNWVRKRPSSFYAGMNIGHHPVFLYLYSTI